MESIIAAETPDLILRSWKPNDREQYDLHCNTDDVMKWLGGRQTASALQDDIAWFEAKEQRFGCTYWVVERKSDQAFLGWCGLVVLEEGDEGVDCNLVGELEIGWRLRADVWGLGYAKQSAVAAMDFAFDRLKALRVISTASQGNADSIGLMMRLGMRHDYARDYGPAGDWRMLVFTLDWSDWNRDASLKPRNI